jgi:hypothetical protein
MAIVVTIGLFWGLDKVSSYALVPYALWVGYAAFAAGIWWLHQRNACCNAESKNVILLKARRPPALMIGEGAAVLQREGFDHCCRISG